MTARYVRGMPSQAWLPGRPDILDVLRDAALEEEALLAAGSNYVYLLRMSHPGAGEGYAVYKPQRGEAPLSDFPDGTLYQREYAAYVVSEAIGWHLIPPTIVRDGLESGIGALQLFIEHDPAQHYFTLKDARQAEMQRIALYDWLTNNADRKGGHCLLAADGRMWCIDQGLTFHTDDKLRTVIWDFQTEPVPPALLDDVRTFATRLETDAALRDTLLDMITPREYERLQERAARIDQLRIFPSPPPYRPYPWPMI
ncbi:MAG: hypothetical protein GEU75_16755 [Dehalococcoidia bacterium]|nr:hypothetical protein [Dehalococcoidia bacterium]